MGRRTWIKLWCDPWIRGSIRQESLAVRGTLATLLALAGDSPYADDGIIKVHDDVPMSDDQLTRILRTDAETWERHKQRLKELEMIEVSQGGEIKILNWTKYQSDYRRKKISDTKSGEKSKKKSGKKSSLEGEREREVEEEKKKNGTCTYVQEFQTSWNTHSRLPRINKMTKGRTRKLQQRRKDEEFCIEWEKAIRYLARTPFYTGDNDRGWRATVDWFLRNDENWRKPLERIQYVGPADAERIRKDLEETEAVPPTAEFKELMQRMMADEED